MLTVLLISWDNDIRLMVGHVQDHFAPYIVARVFHRQSYFCRLSDPCLFCETSLLVISLEPHACCEVQASHPTTN
jgi:hypothetical protein